MGKHDWKGGPRKGFPKTTADWSDPGMVHDEVTRLANHVRDTKERMIRTKTEIEHLEKVLAEGPARLIKLRASIGEDGAAVERLTKKRFEVLQLLEGAKLAQQIERLERRLKDEKVELTRLKTGAPGRAKATHRSRKREADPSLDQHADLDDVR